MGKVKAQLLAEQEHDAIMKDQEPNFNDYALATSSKKVVSEQDDLLDGLNEDMEDLSDCCSALIYPDTDLCSECKEHCGIQGEDDETPQQMNERLRSMGY